ncbi:solute carrier family 35 member G1-like [Ptychodera flava]|uniref:solute carrier family 35 member G1-like n=1 Tax=Ptychodera flava TaxID=63121 RepID=UPI00396A1211
MKDVQTDNSELTQLFPQESESTDKYRGCSSISKSGLGVSLAALSGVLYGLVTILVVLTQNGGAATAQVTLIQNIVCIVFTIPVIAYFRYPFFKYSNRERILLVVNSVVETAGRITLYYAFRFGLAGNVTSITYGILPILTALLACVYNRERWKRVDAINSVFNIAGIILIAGPLFTTNETSEEEKNAALSISLSIATAVLFAVSAVAIHSMPGVRVFVILFYVGAVGVVVTIPMLFLGTSVTWHLGTICWVYLLLEAVCYLLASIAAMFALHRENAATVILLINIQICVAYIGDVFVFGKTVKPLEIVGSVLIITSSAIVALYTCWINRRNTDR